MTDPRDILVVRKPEGGEGRGDMASTQRFMGTRPEGHVDQKTYNPRHPFTASLKAHKLPHFPFTPAKCSTPSGKSDSSVLLDILSGAALTRMSQREDMKTEATTRWMKVQVVANGKADRACGCEVWCEDLRV